MVFLKKNKEKKAKSIEIRNKQVDQMKDFIKENKLEFDSMMKTYVSLINKFPTKFGKDCEHLQEGFITLVINENLRVLDASKTDKKRILALIYKQFADAGEVRILPKSP